MVDLSVDIKGVILSSRNLVGKDGDGFTRISVFYHRSVDGSDIILVHVDIVVSGNLNQVK